MSGQVADRSADVLERIADHRAWRHRIEIAPGVVTPGREDCRAELRRIRFPASLVGRRVLDVGCSDGFYSFEAERRGATEVVALDDESSLLGWGRCSRSEHARVDQVEFRCRRPGPDAGPSLPQGSVVPLCLAIRPWVCATRPSTSSGAHGGVAPAPELAAWKVCSSPKSSEQIRRPRSSRVQSGTCSRPTG